MPLTLAPPPITESLDTGELVVPAPPVLNETPVVMESAPVIPESKSNDLTGAELVLVIVAILVLYGLMRLVIKLLPYLIALVVGIVIVKHFA